MIDPLEEELDIEPAPQQVEVIIEPPATLDADFVYARENIYQTIDTAQKALKELAVLAGSSQTARSYEVLATLARTIIDAQHQLVELQKKKAEIEKVADLNHQPTTVNNNLYVTTAQLGRMIDDVEKRRNEDLSDLPDTTR